MRKLNGCMSSHYLIYLNKKLKLSRKIQNIADHRWPWVSQWTCGLIWWPHFCCRIRLTFSMEMLFINSSFYKGVTHYLRVQKLKVLSSSLRRGIIGLPPSLREFVDCPLSLGRNWEVRLVVVRVFEEESLICLGGWNWWCGLGFVALKTAVSWHMVDPKYFQKTKETPDSYVTVGGF